MAASPNPRLKGQGLGLGRNRLSREPRVEHLLRTKQGCLSFNTGVFQSWALGTVGGDEGREAGDSDDAHAGPVPGVPDAGGVQEDDGEKVTPTLTSTSPCPSYLGAHCHFLILVLGY